MRRRQQPIGFAIEALEDRTLLNGAPIITDTKTFAQSDDSLRNATVAEYRIYADQTQQTVDSAQADLRALMGSIDVIAEEIVRQRHVTDGLQQTSQEFHAQETAEQGTLGALQIQQQQERHALDEIEGSISSIRGSIEGERTALTALQQTGANLEAMLKSLELQRGPLLQEDAAARADVEALRATLASIDSTFAEAERSLAAADEALARCEASLTALSATRTAMESENTEISTQLLVTEQQEIAALQEQETLDSAIERQETQRTSAIDTQQIAQAQYDNAAASLSVATANVARQTQTVQSLQTTLTAQQQQYASLQEQYNAALRMRPRNTKLEKSLKTQMDSMSKQISLTKTALASATSTLNAYVKVETGAKAATATAKTALDKSIADVRAQTEALQSLTQQREAAALRINDAETLLTALIARRATVTQTIAATIAALEAETTAKSAWLSKRSDAQTLATSATARRAEVLPAYTAATDRARTAALQLAANDTSLASTQATLAATRTEQAAVAAALSTSETSLRTLDQRKAAQAMSLATLQAAIEQERADLEALWAAMADTDFALDAAWAELSTEVRERVNLETQASSLSQAVDRALAEDAWADAMLEAFIALDDTLDSDERQATQLDAIVSAIRNAKTAMHNEEAAILQEAFLSRQAELNAREHSILSAISDLPPSLLAEPTMVTPSVRAYTTASNPKNIIIDAKNLPGGMTVTMGYGGKTWQATLAAGSSVIAAPIGAIGHDGQGGLGLVLRLKDASGTQVQEYDFFISGDRFVGDPRSFTSSFPALAHPEQNPVRDGQRTELQRLLFQKAQNDVALQDLANGVTLDAEKGDTRVAIRFMELLRAQASADRGIVDASATLLLDRATLNGTESLAPSTTSLLSPSGTLEAGMRGTTLSLFDPNSQRIVSNIAIGNAMHDMVWSADGSQFAFVAGNRLGIVSLEGQTVQWCALPGEASAVVFLPSGDIAIGMYSGGVCVVVWRNGSLALVGSTLATAGVKNMCIDENGLLRVMTTSECLTVLVDGSAGPAVAVESAPQALAPVSGYERFTYETLNMVYVSGSGHAMMAEAAAHTLGTRLYSMQDIDRLAQQFCPEFYGATSSEVDAKLRTWATTHGVNMDFARGERLKAYQRLEEGINAYRGVVTDHYLRAFWIVHDLLVNPTDQAAMQKKLDIIYGVAGGQIICGIWTPQLPTMRDIFAEVERNDGGIFDRLYDAASGVNTVQSNYWSWRAEANVGATNAGNNEGSSTPRQISSRLQAKINTAVSTYGGGHAVIAGKTYTLAQLQKASSAEPSAYVATVLRPDPTTKDPDSLDQTDLAELFAMDALQARLTSNDANIQGILDVLRENPSMIVAIAGTTDSEALRAIAEEVVRQQLVALADTAFDTIGSIFGTETVEKIRSMNQSRQFPAFVAQVQREAPRLTEQAAVQIIASWHGEAIAPTSVGLPQTTKRWTEVGQLLLGLMNTLENATDKQAFIGAVQAVSVATAIPFSRLLEASLLTGEERTAAMQQLFTEANYGHLFSTTTSDWHGIVSAVPNKLARDGGVYGDGDTIRIRLDFAMPANGATLTDMRVYANPSTPSAGISSISVPVQYNGGYFVTVKASELLSGFGAVDISANLSIIATFSDSSQDTIGVDTIRVKGGVTEFTWVGEGEIKNLNTGEKASLIDFTSAAQLRGNTALLRELEENFFDTYHLQQIDERTWEGDFRGAIVECKPWMNKFVDLATNGAVVLPSMYKANQPDFYKTGAWDESGNMSGVDSVGTMTSNFVSLLASAQALPGDIIQMYGAFGKKGEEFPHTMMIGKIESNGIWVIDSNFGTNDGYVQSENGQIYVPDVTIRYHFLHFDSMNAKVLAATIYRITL